MTSANCESYSTEASTSLLAGVGAGDGIGEGVL